MKLLLAVCILKKCKPLLTKLKKQKLFDLQSKKVLIEAFCCVLYMWYIDIEN